MQEKRSAFKRTVLKAIRVFGWIWLGIIALILFLVLIIRIPAVQNKIVQRVVLSLKETTGAEISLDRILISFPKRIVMENLLVANPQQDTLLYAGRISVDADLIGLLSHRIQLNDVGLTDIRGQVTRGPDGDFNFQFMLDSLAGEEAPHDSPSKPWDFTIRRVTLEKIDVRYDDHYSGIFSDVIVKSLQARARNFDLTGGLISLSSVDIDGLRGDMALRQGSAPDTASVDSEETEPNTPLSLTASTIDIKESQIRFRDEQSGSE